MTLGTNEMRMAEDAAKVESKKESREGRFLKGLIGAL